jgi:hypothetical protein
MTRGDLMAVVWKDKSDDVMCVKQGAWRKQWCSDVSRVTWRSVWTEIVLPITTQKQLIRHLFIHPPCKHLKPRPQCK